VRDPRNLLRRLFLYLPGRAPRKLNLVLRVWLLGPMRLELDGVEVAPPSSRKARLLLSILALERRAHSREPLAARLWPDVLDASARVSLRTALTQLRATFGNAAERFIYVTREHVALAGADEVWTDVAELERSLTDGDLDVAIDVDPAELLAGLEDDWVYDRREQLLTELVSALGEGATKSETEGDLARAVRLARRQTALDPLAEEPQRQLIRRLAAAGDRSAALATYEKFADRLRSELRIAPSAPTRSLAEAIRAGEVAQAASPPAEMSGVSATEPSVEPRRDTSHGEPAAGAAAVRKSVTVLFADIIEATSPEANVDAEVRERVVSRCLIELRTVLERNGGTVETHPGDVLLGVFGVPVLHEDDAIRAVRSAVELRRSLPAILTDPAGDDQLVLAMRAGIETGEVITGRGAAVVTGESVSRARRLCELAAPSELLIGAGTHELVSHAVLAEALSGHRSASGQAIAAYRLQDVLADAPMRIRRFESPIIGRERQLATLQTVFTNVVSDRSCHLATVLGAAGVGKSRLVEELAKEFADGATVIYGRCLPYGEGITFWPLAEALRGLIGNAEPSAATIAAQVEDDPQAELIGDGVAVGLGVRDRPGGTSEETFWATRKLFETVARKRPLIAVFDDLHWAEPTFLDFVEHVSELARDAPILLLCMARPELLDSRPAWGGGKLNATTVLLEPLDAVQSRRLIESLLGSSSPPATVANLVAEVTEGNPLFTEEFLALLIDRDLLRVSDGRWTIPAELSQLPVPPTINALLAARLERLPPGERSLLERAAVEGAHFHRATVCELSPNSQTASVDTGLARLVRKDLIRPDRVDFTGDEGYRFRHVLIRDAAYGSLPKQARAELHERFGSWLEQTAAERLREVEELVGYHLGQASDLLTELRVDEARARELGSRASRRLESAGRRALSRGDRAAIPLLERAASLPGPDDMTSTGLLTDLGTALLEAGRMADSESVLARASALAREADDECGEAKVLIEQQFLGLERAPDDAIEEAAAIVERVIPVLRRHGDEQGLCRAFRLQALLHWFAARTGAAASAWEQAAVHAMRAGAEHERADILVWIASSLVYGPTPVADGIVRCEEIAIEVQGNLVAHASTLPKLAALHAMDGRFDLARELLARSNSAFDELGLWLNSAVSHQAALVELLAGDYAEAERSLRVGYEALEEMGDKSLLSTTAAYLARATLAQGRDEEAERYAAQSEQLAAADDVSTHAIWRGVRAQVLAKRGQIEDAERLARSAVTALAESDFVNLQGEALLELATVLEHGGRHEEAASALSESLKLLERKGNKVTAEQVRSFLLRAASS
jgi:DNA-binding SARP family transcriptional activator/tetratricopeptide (TPR) repeat protein